MHDSKNSYFYINGTETLIQKTNSLVKTFPLRLVSQDELLNLRVSKIPGFVLKLDNRLYFAEIEYSTVISCIENLPCKHLCAICTNCLPNKCIKIQDGPVSFNLKYISSDYRNAVAKASRIDKYSFIHDGFETFNTVNDSFLIFDCGKYEIYKNLTKNHLNTNKKLSTYLDEPIIDSEGNLKPLLSD